MIDHAKMVAALKDVGELRRNAFNLTPKLSPSVSTPSQIAEAEEELASIVDELQYRIDLMKESFEGFRDPNARMSNAEYREHLNS